MDPVPAAELEPVLARDLARSLQSGRLAPWTGGGVSIGAVQRGVRRVFSFGAAAPQSIFEIGSLTKPFTGLLLARMICEGSVRLDEPVRELLPAGALPRPSGREITLLDLVTQRSGLPRLPGNLRLADRDNPYARYDAARLYAFLARRGLERPQNAPFLYSNLGFGLLGHALALRAGVPFGEFLRTRIAGPLGLADTTVTLTPAQQRRLLPGHDASHGLAHAWDFDCLAGAGAIRSTAGDMLRFLEANLHPEHIKPDTAFQASAALPSALRLSQQLHADALPGMRIALGWLYHIGSGKYWHNGATGGFSSYAYFNPAEDCAAVVLFNTSIGRKGSFAEQLGEHIGKRLAGKPAIALD
jgi:serine-type D-Ala-D-Ala carboxypeptidase/endopeptidase